MKRTLLAPKLFYFAWFAALGAFSPFVVLYYRDVGLDEAQIGQLSALSGLLTIAAAPLWGVLADALRLRRVLLPLAVLGTVLPVLLIGQTAAPLAITALVAALALFSSPVSALSDSATLALLGERSSRYGAQRVWGAVGWMLSTLVFGWLIGRSGLWLAFPAYAALGALAALAAWLLPSSNLPQVDLRPALAAIVRNRRWGFFLGSVLLIGFCNTATHAFLSLYLQDLGADDGQIGLAISVGSLSELPVMAFAPLVLRRWGARPLMVLAGALYAVRIVLLALAPSFGWALAAQLLHGPCFAALWTGGVEEARRLAPRGLEATAQSLFSTMFFGIATAIASTVGGLLYRDYGYTALFAFCAAAALLGTCGLLFGMRGRPVLQPEIAGE
jgi:PPP family 3-phenylpropionic acid transporter